MHARAVAQLLAAAFLFCASPAVDAQLFRAYLASDGSDANPCTLSQPCRLLPAALSAVAFGGEIWMLDSANYNTAQVDIAKSVAILAIPGAVGSLIAPHNFYAIAINTPAVKVSLRNLVVVPGPGASVGAGVNFQQGAELNIADCEFARLSGYAVVAQAPTGVVTMKQTRMRENGLGGVIATAGATVYLSRVDIVDGNWGVWAEGPSRVTVSESTITKVGTGVYVCNDVASTTTQVSIERSVIGRTNTGIRAQSCAGSTTSYITATGNTISHATYGIMTDCQGAGASCAVGAGDNTIAYTNYAFYFNVATGQIYSRGNNTVWSAIVGEVGGGGSLSPFPGI